MPYTIPIGPYHPSLDEPYKTTVHCQGEKIQDIDIDIGYNFRAIELLAQRRNYVQDLTLVERVCGICSGVHTLTFALAIESIAGIEVPPRALYIRLIVAELERLHSHLLWAGVAAELISFQTLFMEAFALREQVMDVLEAISGNRVNYAMNCIGGVNRDLLDPAAIQDAVHNTRELLEQDVVPVFLHNPTVRARTEGVGILAHQDALDYGVVGPVARASGVAEDIRSARPYLVYEELGFKITTAEEGDVRARIVVRALEILESVRLVEEALRRMPGGPIRIPDLYPAIPPGETVARTEAPRGELLYYIASDGSDTPARIKIRTPTFVNIPAVRPMAVGQDLADMPLIQAALDPCYSCTDR
jgi:Ni,Fe-hydrogenase III large subunit